MTTSSTARADASFQEQVHRQWRDWRAYLQAHLTMLEAQSAERQVAFERADALEEQIAQAQRSLALLPAGQRVLFDGIREERRQRTQEAVEAAAAANGQTRAADPDQIERQTLELLLAEAEGLAEGQDRVSGWGDVPLPGDGGAQWYRVNVQALLEAPSAAAYAVGQHNPDDTRRRIMLAGLIGVATVIFLVVWFLWPRGTPRQGGDENSAVLVNGTPTTTWSASSATLATQRGEAVVVDLAPVAGDAWPSVAKDAQTGFWREGAVAPVTVCIHGSLLADATSLRLAGGGEVPQRLYLLSPARGLEPDLLVEPCAGSSPPRYGTFQRLELPSVTAIGQTAVLADEARVSVEGITIVGPGEEPGLPAGTARIVVTVSGPSLDWPAYAPTLLLASGESIQSPEVLTTAQGAQLRYITPLPASELEVAWSLRSPDTGQSARWRMRLPAPPDRATVVRRAIAVPSVEVKLGQPSVLEITVTNRGGEPIQLTASDIVLTQGSQQLTVPDLAGLQRPLAGGERRVLELPLAESLRSSALTLTIGSARFAIEP